MYVKPELLNLPLLYIGYIYLLLCIRSATARDCRAGAYASEVAPAVVSCW